jgi:hypothetical protein
MLSLICNGEFKHPYKHHLEICLTGRLYATPGAILHIQVVVKSKSSTCNGINI